MFQERLKEKKPIFLHEFLYPLAQAYDSVAMNVDLEVGGKDQLFNMLCGRDLMKVLKNKEKFVLGMKLLTGPEGKKMGKTEGNAVNMDDDPKDMYGKIMSWPDESIIPGFDLCTNVPEEDVRKIEKDIKDNKTNPRDAKAMLAKKIVEICHGEKEAKEAEEEFESVFKENSLPSEIPEVPIKEKEMDILDLLVEAKLVSSKAEAKRMIVQKGVKIGGKVEEDWKAKIEIKKGLLVQVGKRKFVKIS